MTWSGARFVTVQAGTAPVANGAALLGAYATAKTMSPTAGAPVTVIVPPGNYDLGTGALTLDTPWINLAGLTTARETQHIYGATSGANTGVLMQTADQVLIENLTVECTLATGTLAGNGTDPAAYWPDVAWNSGANRGSPPNTTIRNCQFMSDDTHGLSMRRNIDYAGTYDRCKGGFAAFGTHGTASGTFTDCTGGNDAFGGNLGTASGTFSNCTGGYYAFGGGGRAIGTFTDCTGGNAAFGGDGNTASGTFTGCTGGDAAFGGQGGTAPGGKFYHCVGGAFSFTESGSPTPVQYWCIQNGVPYPDNN